MVSVSDWFLSPHIYIKKIQEIQPDVWMWFFSMYVIILNMFVCFVQQALCCFCGSMMCILPDFEHHALFGEYVCLNVASNITCAASKIQRSYIIFDIINTK